MIDCITINLKWLFKPNMLYAKKMILLTLLFSTISLLNSTVQDTLLKQMQNEQTLLSSKQDSLLMLIKQTDATTNNQAKRISDLETRVDYLELTSRTIDVERKFWDHQFALAHVTFTSLIVVFSIAVGYLGVLGIKKYIKDRIKLVEKSNEKLINTYRNDYNKLHKRSNEILIDTYYNRYVNFSKNQEFVPASLNILSFYLLLLEYVKTYGQKEISYELGESAKIFFDVLNMAIEKKCDFTTNELTKLVISTKYLIDDTEDYFAEDVSLVLLKRALQNLYKLQSK